MWVFYKPDFSETFETVLEFIYTEEGARNIESTQYESGYVAATVYEYLKSRESRKFDDGHDESWNAGWDAGQKAGQEDEDSNWIHYSFL